MKNKGGHSAVPSKDNAIYRLAEGLTRLSKFSFPINLNDTTRSLLRADRANGRRTNRLRYSRCIVRSVRSIGGAGRLSVWPRTRSITRCCGQLALRPCLRAAAAINALPQLASAKINCRIMPGENVDQIKTYA